MPYELHDFQSKDSLFAVDLDEMDAAIYSDDRLIKSRTEYVVNDILSIEKGGWRKGTCISTTGTFTNSTKHVASLGANNTFFLLEGSYFTVNEGYTFDYAFWRVPMTAGASTSDKIKSQRGLAAGTVITVPEDCYVGLSVKYADDSDIPEDVTPEDFAALSFTGVFYISSIKDKVSEVGSLCSEATKGSTASGVLNEALIWPDNIADISNCVAGNMNVNGVINYESANYKVSDYFYIKPDTTYINRTSSTIICLYDYDKKWLTGFSAGSSGVFTTPSNAVYARMSSNIVPANWQINEGSTLLDRTAWEPIKINKERISEDQKSPYDHGPYITLSGDFTSWYEGLQSDYTIEGFTRHSLYSEVITAFDALQALDPDYITKSALGTASGLDANQNEYTMYEYTFTPKERTNPLRNKKVPKVYLDGSIHGFEKCSTFGLYFFLKDLVSNWDKNLALEAIRRSVELHVIPVSNPYGFDNVIYLNGNRVNINRNFDHPGEWSVNQEGSDYNSLAPFDQPESIILRDWLLEGEPDMMFYLNLHANGRDFASPTDEMNICRTSSDRNDTYFNRMFEVLCTHLEVETLRWPKSCPTLSPGTGFCGKISNDPTVATTKGTVSQWANTMRHIVAMTLEGFNGVGPAANPQIALFSADAYKINSENIGNMVIQMLREYA